VRGLSIYKQIIARNIFGVKISLDAHCGNPAIMNPKEVVTLHRLVQVSKVSGKAPVTCLAKKVAKCLESCSAVEEARFMKAKNVSSRESSLDPIYYEGGLILVITSHKPDIVQRVYITTSSPEEVMSELDGCLR